MLRYKVKLNEPKGYNEIICDELYLSPDMSYISGVTDISYGLINNQSLKIEFNSDNNFHDCKAQIKNVTRQGYVILNQLFKTEEVEGVKLYRYVDGKFYSATTETVNRNVTYWVEDGKIVIDKDSLE